MFYRGHRPFTEDVNLVRSYFKDSWRTDLLALTAPIALVRIDDDVPITGAILETIIGYHLFSFFPPHPFLPAGRLSLSRQGRGE